MKDDKEWLKKYTALIRFSKEEMQTLIIALVMSEKSAEILDKFDYAKSFKNLREVLDCGLHKWIAFNTVIISSNRVPIKFLSGINPPKWFPKTCHHFVDSPSTIWHRSVYEEVGPFDESLDYVMDVDYWYRIIKLGYSFTRYNQYVYCLRVHDGSKTQSHGYSGFRLSKKTRLTIEPNLQKASQSKYVTAKHDIAHSFSCSLAVKILKLRPSRIKDLYYRYFRNIEI